jgi:hypothetical protein
MQRVMEEALRRNPEGGLEEFEAHVQRYGSEEEEPEPEPEYRTVLEAVEAAKSNLSRLKFLDSALDSAKKTNTDADPAEVYEIFRRLNEDIWKEMKTSMDQDKLSEKKIRVNVQKMLNDWLGGKFAEGESSLTMDKFGKEKNPNGRMFSFGDDSMIRIEPHIKLGSKNKLRIHLLCLNPENNYEAVISYTKRNGKIGTKKAKPVRSFPSIIIGWCGDHLPVARLTG